MSRSVKGLRVYPACKLAFCNLKVAGRRQKTPGPETEQFLTHNNDIFKLVP